MSRQTAAVLHAMSADPSRWRYGYELGQEVGLKPGSLYPILMRLHERGLLHSSWEGEPAGGRPPRHLYQLTPAGIETAAEMAAEVTNAAAEGKRSFPRPAGGSLSAVHVRAMP